MTKDTGGPLPGPESSSLNPLELAAQRLDAHFGISGPMDEGTEGSDGQEYTVTFPPNRGQSKRGKPSENQPKPRQRPIKPEDWAKALEQQKQEELEEGRRRNYKPGDTMVEDTLFE